MDTINTKKSWFNKERSIWLGICLVLFLIALGLLVWLLTLYLPAPRFTDFPGVTNKEQVNLKGVSGSNLGVVLFGKDSKAVASVNADENGNFVFENVVLADGENKFFARALDAGKKVSKPSLEIVVKLDKSAPDLEFSLAEGTSVSEKAYLATGKAEPGSVVVVNGITATVAEDGTWTVAYTLSQERTP